jgi:hypothetical protein
MFPACDNHHLIVFAASSRHLNHGGHPRREEISARRDADPAAAGDAHTAAARANFTAISHVRKMTKLPCHQSVKNGTWSQL